MLDQPRLMGAHNWETFTKMIRHMGMLIQSPIFKVTIYWPNHGLLGYK